MPNRRVPWSGVLLYLEKPSLWNTVTVDSESHEVENEEELGSIQDHESGRVIQAEQTHHLSVDQIKNSPRNAEGKRVKEDVREGESTLDD